MAEFQTDFYRLPQQPGPKQIGPMEALQMLGQLNQNSLFRQTFDARQNIGDAYKKNVNPDGTINSRGLTKDIAGSGGFLAGEGIGTAVGNATNQAALDKTNVKYAQESLGALATKKDLKPSDLANWGVTAKRAGVPADVVDGLIDGAYQSKDPKKFLATQSLMAQGVDALKGTAGTPDEEGRIPQITEGEAQQRRLGLVNNKQPTSGFVTSNPPGYQEAASTSGQVMAAARTRAANYGADVFPMTQALSNLEKLGPTGTGPGTSELNTIKSFVQSNLNWLPGAEKVYGNPESIKNFDEAQKYLTNIAGARAGQFGHGTDQALSTALTASPNTHISNLAAVDLTKATIALRRMEQAQTLQADAEAVSPGKFSSWASKWATNVDPRAFMVDLMNKEQLQNLQKTLKNPAERKKFNSSVKTAIENGLITRPGGEHNPGE